MSYNNSIVGEFIEPEGRAQKKDNLNIIDGKHSVHSMIDTRAFGSNVVLNIEGAPMISYSKGAESKKVFGEISPTNDVSLISSGIGGKLYMNNSRIYYTKPYTTSIAVPFIRRDDKNWLAYVTNMCFDLEHPDDDIPTKYGSESIDLPYITVIGRSLDSYANKHNGKRITDPFVFGVDSTIKVKVLIDVIDVEGNTPELEIPITVPKIPVYAKITTGIYSSIPPSTNTPRVLLPLPHLQFPMVAYIGGETMFHSGRCFFENTSNNRVSAATCGYYPVSSDLIGKTLRDEYETEETEPESGLLTHTHISNINGSDKIVRFGDFVAMHNGIIKDSRLEDYGETKDVMSFGVRKELHEAIEDLFKDNDGALAYKALLKNDFTWSGTKMFTGQKVFKDTIAISPSSNNNDKPYLEIEYRVVTINKAQNSIKDPEDSERFSYAAEQMVSLIPLNASVSTYDDANNSWKSNDLPEIVTNMQVINPPNSICDADRNVAVATSSEDIRGVAISAESILLFAMPDMSDKIIGIASGLYYGEDIVKNAIIPIFELDEVSITSNEYIFLPDYYSLRVNTFSVLAYDDYEKVITFEIEIDEYEEEECKTLISTQKKTYCCSLYHYDNYPMAQLSATGVLNSYLMTTKRVPDEAVVNHNVNVEVPSNFVHNSFKFSSVKGRYTDRNNFREYGRYSLYQDYEETQGDTTLGEALLPRGTQMARSHSYPKDDSSNAGFTYKGQAMIDFFVGNSQFSDKITTNSIDFSIGNSSLLTLRSFYSNAASVYSTGNGIKTYRDVEIIPLVYPVPFFMKNNSKETTACVSYCGAHNDNYMYGGTVGWSSSLYWYLYYSEYFQEGTKWKRNFLSNIEITPEVYSQISSHMHAIDIQRPHLSGGSFCSIELLDYEVEGYEPTNFFGISSVIGSLIVSKTPKVIEGGALETIDDVTGVLGIDMTRGSLIASNNEVVINENRYLLFNGKIYKPSNYFQKMSTTSNEEVNSLVSGESSLSIPPFIFINRGNSYGVCYSSRDTFSLTFNGVGKLIDTPIKHERTIFFGDVNRGTLNIYAIGENSVNNIFSSNIKKMYSKFSLNEENNNVDIISIKMICPESISQPMCLVKLKEKESADHHFNINIFLYPSGVSFSDGIDYNYIIIPTVYGEASTPLFVDKEQTLMEIIETDATSESEFTIESSKIDIHDNGAGIFVPLALELYYTQVDKTVYNNGEITNNEVDYEILCDEHSAGTIIDKGVSRAIPNTKNKLVCEFTLDKNLYDSFYFKLRGTGIKIRNISIVGYYVEKN